jgi:putative hydrolase of the HAD superfamily
MLVDWKQIDTVLLDMDGTILDLHFDNFFWLEYLPKLYAEKQGIPLEESKRFLKSSYDQVRGQLVWYCLDHWSKKLAIDIPEVKKSLGHMVKFRPQALAFLQAIHDMHKQVILVTNAHPKSLEIKLLNAQFHDYFDALHSSHQFGVPKEFQAYWYCLNDKFNFEPARTLFIDDSISILRAAKRFGLGHVFGIKQPDSTQPPLQSDEFTLLESFDELLPELVDAG